MKKTITHEPLPASCFSCPFHKQLTTNPNSTIGYHSFCELLKVELQNMGDTVRHISCPLEYVEPVTTIGGGI